MADKIEITENEEKKTNKVVAWIKDHKRTIRDIAIGAGAVGALVALTQLGKSESEVESDDEFGSDDPEYLEAMEEAKALDEKSE